MARERKEGVRAGSGRRHPPSAPSEAKHPKSRDRLGWREAEVCEAYCPCIMTGSGHLDGKLQVPTMGPDLNGGRRLCNRRPVLSPCSSTSLMQCKANHRRGRVPIKLYLQPGLECPSWCPRPRLPGPFLKGTKWDGHERPSPRRPESVVGGWRGGRPHPGPSSKSTHLSCPAAGFSRGAESGQEVRKPGSEQGHARCWGHCNQ